MHPDTPFPIRLHLLIRLPVTCSPSLSVHSFPFFVQKRKREASMNVVWYVFLKYRLCFLFHSRISICACEEQVRREGQAQVGGSVGIGPWLPSGLLPLGWRCSWGSWRAGIKFRFVSDPVQFSLRIC